VWGAALSIGAFGGSIGAFGGSIGAFGGSIGAFGGSIGALIDGESDGLACVGLSQLER